MKFLLKGRVNYLPAFTYNRLQNNFAEIDFDYDLSDNDIKAALSAGVTLSTKCNLPKSKLVKTGMEALNLDSKAGGDSLKSDNLTLNEVKDAASTHIVQNAIESAGIKQRVFTVEKGVKIVKPLKIFYKADESYVNNHIIELEEDSALTIIEIFESLPKNNLLGARTRVYASRNSKIKLVRVNLLSDKTVHFDDIGFHLEENAHAELVQLELGAEKTYLGVRTELIGDKSSFENSTGYLCKENNFLDMNFIVNEWGKKASSNMLASGVLFNNATKVYRGSIDFKEGSCGASGFENESTLLFGNNIINKTIPLILCHEADVEGDHGATMGRIDDNLLFYIKSHGIDDAAAKELMTAAYINAITNRIRDEETEEKVKEYVSEVFGNE